MDKTDVVSNTESWLKSDEIDASQMKIGLQIHENQRIGTKSDAEISNKEEVGIFNEGESVISSGPGENEKKGEVDQSAERIRSTISSASFTSKTLEESLNEEEEGQHNGSDNDNNNNNNSNSNSNSNTRSEDGDEESQEDNSTQASQQARNMT